MGLARRDMPVDPRPLPAPPTPLPTVTVTAPRSVPGPQPSFFSLTTVNALRRDTSTAQAIRSGELTRTVTLPALTVTATPSAIALSGSTAPVVTEGVIIGGGVGGAVFKSETGRETLHYVCVGTGICNGGRPSLQRIQQRERAEKEGWCRTLGKGND